MKQKTNTTMLLLPCAVIAALIGITAYFACSADDDWEGTPEYLHTHAPMQTRAGVDVGGNVYGQVLWINSNGDNEISSTKIVDGINGFTARVIFNWTGGRFSNLNVNQSIYDENNNITIDMPDDIDTIRYELSGTPYFPNSPSKDWSGNETSWSAYITTQLNLQYTKKIYNSNGDLISTYNSGNIPVIFSVDVKSYTYWTYIEDK